MSLYLQINVVLISHQENSFCNWWGTLIKNKINKNAKRTELSHKEYIYKTTLYLRSNKHCERGREMVDELEDQKGSCKMVSPCNFISYTHKVLHSWLLKWAEQVQNNRYARVESPGGHNPTQRTTGN